MRGWLKDTFYSKIQDMYQDVFSQKIVLNTISTELVKAFRDGKITYENKTLKGSFSSQITKQLKEIGAVYDKRIGGFKLDSLPPELLNLQYEKEKQVKTFVHELDNFIEEYKNNLDKAVDLMDISFESALMDLNNQLELSFENVGIEPNLSEFQQKYIIDNFMENMKFDIKKWLEKDIIRLRYDINDIMMGGCTPKTLANHIQQGYFVSQEKAMFLTRNEYKLITTKYSESQYKKNGITKYYKVA